MASDHPFASHWRAVATECQLLAPGIRCVLAANASPLTGAGTNSYLIGDRSITLIDPGPGSPSHLDALIQAIPHGGHITKILVTHAHCDHSELAQCLSRQTRAPVLAFGNATAGRSSAMTAMALQGDSAGGEGVDHDFTPDHLLADGAQIETELGPLTALWTPGHFAGHLCFALGDDCFSGDLVMGWSTSLVSPPDGDMAAYLASLARLASLTHSRFFPGHGAPVLNPAARLAELTRHRHEREARLLACLDDDFQSIAALTSQVYADTPLSLHPAAARNLFAHLIDLAHRNLAQPDQPLGFSARFRRQ